MNKQERENRIVARGEHSGHAHVLIGGTFKNEVLTVAHDDDAVIRHLIETAWTDRGDQVWTQEHKDIKLKAGNYRIVQQHEFSPRIGRAVRVRD